MRRLYVAVITQKNGGRTWARTKDPLIKSQVEQLEVAGMVGKGVLHYPCETAILAELIGIQPTGLERSSVRQKLDRNCRACQSRLLS